MKHPLNAHGSDCGMNIGVKLDDSLWRMPAPTYLGCRGMGIVDRGRTRDDAQEGASLKHLTQLWPARNSRLAARATLQALLARRRPRRPQRQLSWLRHTALPYRRDSAICLFLAGLSTLRFCRVSQSSAPRAISLLPFVRLRPWCEATSDFFTVGTA